MVDICRKIKSDYIKYLDGDVSRDYTIADPPWNFDDKPRHFGIEFTRWDHNLMRMTELFYKVTSPLLFLWAPVSLSAEVFEAFHNHNKLHKPVWQYKNRFNWVKLTVNKKIHYGTGHWVRNSTEDLFIFARPDMKPFRLNIRNAFTEVYLGNTHKPRGFESKLVKLLHDKGLIRGLYLFSGNRRLEVFNAFDIDLVDTDVDEL